MVGAAGCGKPPPDRDAKGGEPTSATGHEETWPPERIAADPDGYLQYADGKIREQVEGREKRLAHLEERRLEIERKSAGILQQVEDARNIHARLSAALQRAEDEDRWPIKFAGRTFSKEKAVAVLGATESYVKDREPLAAAYREALNKVDGVKRSLRSDLASLAQMRERLALDLERVRLNQGIAELSSLRQTEAQLANFSSTLAGMTDDPLTAPSTNVPDMDVNDLLN